MFLPILLLILKMGHYHEEASIVEFQVPKCLLCDHTNAKISFKEPYINKYHKKLYASD